MGVLNVDDSLATHASLLCELVETPAPLAPQLCHRMTECYEVRGGYWLRGSHPSQRTPLHPCYTVPYGALYEIGHHRGLLGRAPEGHIMPTCLRTRASITILAAATALTSLTACGGSHDTAKAPSGGVAASHEDNAPDLPGTALFTFMSAKEIPASISTATVPGLNSTTVDVYSSKPTTGTFPEATDNGQKHSAPKGKSLVAYGAKLNVGVTAPSGQGYTLSVLADGKPVHSENISQSDVTDGKGFLTAVPDNAKITVRLSGDKGQQNVPAGSTTRDDATSNGLPVSAKVNLPIASATQCDASGEATAPTKTVACANLSFTWTDHTNSLGWAPPGKAWLTLHAARTWVPTRTSDEGSLMGESYGYVAPNDLKITNARLGKDAADDKDQDGVTSLNMAFPTAANNPATTITADVSWRNVGNLARPGSGTLTLTGRTATPVKYGPPFH